VTATCPFGPCKDCDGVLTRAEPGELDQTGDPLPAWTYRRPGGDCPRAVVRFVAARREEPAP
jgi:hypothetical protein